MSLTVERHPDRIVAELDTIEAAHRARDHDAGRESDLDDPAAAAFWRAVIADHAARAEVEISTLHLDGHLAAYVVAFLDPPAYRVFDGRLVSAWARYAPGRILEAEVLARVLRDPQLQAADWMTSLAPEKLIAADTAQPTLTVTARSESAAPLAGAQSAHQSR